MKRLAKEELGVDIQTGEHSSVSLLPGLVVTIYIYILLEQITDARAAMAIYRLHKHAWDASLPVSHLKPPTTTSRQKTDIDEDNEDVEVDDQPEAKRKRRSSNESFPGGGRRGVSSGLSTIVRTNMSKGVARNGALATRTKNASPKGKWWQTLGGSGGTVGSKGQIHLS